MANLNPRVASVSIDFGTSHTVVTMRRADGRVHQQLFDGSPQLPSAVFLGHDGGPIVGADAVHEGRRDPERLEPNPKRRIDDGTILLGETELPATGVIAAVLARVARECGRTLGGLGPVTVTVPASWGPSRRHAVADAAAAAGLGRVSLVAEPVAAASYFAEVLGSDVPVGSGVVVYDLGGGTFDATALRRTPSGFEVLAVEGVDDLGGLDFDQALAEHLSRSFRPEDPRWSRLMAPQSGTDLRHRVSFLDEVRGAKERLSRITATNLTLPLFGADVHLTRDELEPVVAPLLERTVRITQGVIREAGLAPEQIAGLFLVGAASRMPLAATMLHRGLGIAPAAIEQPELAVSEGGLVARTVISSPAAPAGGAVSEAPHTPPQRSLPPGSAPPGERPLRTGRGLLVLLAVVVAAALVAVPLAVNLSGGDGTGQRGSISGLGRTGEADEESAAPTEPGAESTAAEAGEESALLQHARNGGAVRIGYFEEYPFTYTDENGDLTGYSVDLYLHLFARLGIEESQIEWVNMEWSNLIAGLGISHDLFVSGMYITPERCSQVAFGSPDLLTPKSLLVLDGNPLGLTDIASIAKHDSAVVGVVAGSTDQSVVAELGIPDDRVSVQDTLEALVPELKAGLIDAIAYNRIYLEDKASGDEELEVGVPFWPDDPETGEDMIGAGGAAFQPSDAAFRDALDEELATLMNDLDQWEALAGEYGFTAEANLPPEDLTTEDLCEGEYQ